MSELAPRGPEREHKLSPELEQHHTKTVEKAIEKGRHVRNEHAEKLLHLQHEVKQEALAAREHLTDEAEAAPLQEEQPTLLHRDLTDASFSGTLRQTRKSLKAPERVFSKVIHNPTVDAVSDVAGKTIARPSGILAGGIFACIGSTLFLWVTKHYGYEYNYLLFALLFAGGFVLGLLIEFGMRIFRRTRV